MWNIHLIIGSIVVFFLSLFILVANPEMHKPAVITDSEYGFIQIEMPPAQLCASDTGSDNAPQIVEEQPAEVQQPPQNNRQITYNSTGSNNNGQSASQKYNAPTKTKNNQYNNAQQQKPQYKQTPPGTKNSQGSSASPSAQNSQTNKQQTNANTQPVSTQKPQTTTVQKPIQQTQFHNKDNIENKEKPILTEQEEIIAWNRWRSNLQNQVMKDSKVMAPLGTTFKFSFTVDKYGNMSNVKVWSVSPAYTDYAVKIIKPVLMSYRNKPILNFPAGTRRIVTNVDGGFTISRVTQYSTPEHYHDYERVKH